MGDVKHNVILFGEAGAGKSSIVNMIVGGDVAPVSNSAEGCTFRSEPHETTIGPTTFVIYDTAGLNEGDQGRVPHFSAIQELYRLVRELDGVSLLIYCMRGRVKENAKANWTLFNKVICAEKVPTIVVVTGLETYDDPDQWWANNKNQEVLKKNGMSPKDVGCVVSFPGKKNELLDIYKKSQKKVRKLIMENHLQEPWSVEKNKWLTNIYSETYSSQLCFISQSRLEYSDVMRGMVVDLVKETGMKPEDAKKLNTTLLKAEKKLRRGGILFRNLF